MPPPAGHVRLYTADGDLSVTARLDDEPPKMTAGYGGWERLERRYRLPILEWQRGDLYGMSVGLKLDGFRDDRSVEREIAIVEQMARTPGGEDPPPILYADGPLPRSKRVRWVIESLEWGESSWKGQVRVRQQVSVLLAQFEEDEKLRMFRPKRGAAVNWYTVKEGGQSLERIAADRLKSAKRWREIRDLNPWATHMHPKKIPGGTKLRMPS
jgi:hypothetical protein